MHGEKRTATEVHLQKTLNRAPGFIQQFEIRSIRSCLHARAGRWLQSSLWKTSPCGKQACRRAPAGALDCRLPGRLHEEVCDESQRDLFSHP